ncbi:MAG TPA: thioesterase family protein [Phycisphaerae bacterium]|nr:thioesterase family protein [Phycisphaerae bacterium]
MSSPVGSCDIEIRVRYAEVDQMGVLHHSRCWVYFEMGRTELLRRAGVPYRDLEQAGVFFVVARCSAKYLLPARYDDELILTTRIAEMGRARIDHEYELKRKADGRLLATARTTLACVDRDGRLIPIPDSVRGA